MVKQIQSAFLIRAVPGRGQATALIMFRKRITL